MESGFFDAIGTHAKKQAEIAQLVEHLPFEASHFSIETLNKVILITKDLKKVTANLPIETAISAAVGYLDSHRWAARFTSGDKGVRNPTRDSLYYLTSEGISLRLKMTNKDTGDINKVIQPFFEKMFFEDATNNISLQPYIGCTGQEFASRGFLALQDTDKVTEPFESQIRSYTKDGRPFLIKNVTGGLAHTSSTINFIR